MRIMRLGLSQLIIGMCLSSLLLNSAKAAEPTWFGETADGRWLVGVRALSISNSAEDFRDTDNLGVVLGYEFSRPMGYNGKSTIEFEGTTTNNEGEIGPASALGIPGVWDVDTYALHFAYKTPGTVYFKAKMGAIQSKITTNTGGLVTELDDVGLSFGAGLGVNAGKHVQIEAEFAGATGDNDISSLSLGATVLF